MSNVTVRKVTTAPSYLEKLRRLIEDGHLKLRPGLAVLEVFHDTHCGVFNGKPCDCGAEVRPPEREAD